MQITDLTRCRIIGHSKLLTALPLLYIATHCAQVAFVRGMALDYIITAIIVLVYGHFAHGWMVFVDNECMTTHHFEDTLCICQKNGYTFWAQFKDVKKITRDRRGYTMHVDKIGRCRFPNKHIDADLQHIFDAHIARLEELKQARSSALPADPT